MRSKQSTLRHMFGSKTASHVALKTEAQAGEAEDVAGGRCGVRPKAEQDENWTYARALALPFSMLPDCATRRGEENSWDAVSPSDLGLSDADQELLRSAVDGILLKPSKGATEHDDGGGRTMKDLDGVREAWCEVFRWRRVLQNDDTAQLSPEQTSRVWNDWCHHWIRNELRPEQQRKSMRQKTSIFASWVHRTYGCKHLALALLKTGIKYSSLR